MLPALGFSAGNRRTWVQLDVPVSEGTNVAQAESGVNSADHFHYVEPTLTVPGAVGQGSLSMDPPGCPRAIFFKIKSTRKH